MKITLPKEKINRILNEDCKPWLVDAAIEFIKKHARTSKPFFAVVWFGSPHLRHEALQQGRAIYNNAPDNLQHFYGEITAMDSAFGKLRK